VLRFFLSNGGRPLTRQAVLGATPRTGCQYPKTKSHPPNRPVTPKNQPPATPRILPRVCAELIPFGAYLSIERENRTWPPQPRQKRLCRPTSMENIASSITDLQHRRIRTWAAQRERPRPILENLGPLQLSQIGAAK